MNPVMPQPQAALPLADIVQPPEDGDGAARAMSAALKQAQLEPSDIGYSGIVVVMRGGDAWR